MRTGTSKEEAEDHDALDSDSVAPDNDDLETVETQSNDEPPDRDVNALDVTAETEADDESDEEYELLPRLPDFTHLGLPDRSPMWWGTYCKSVATILERYEQQAVVRLSKRNILWLFSQLHLVTVTTVLTTRPASSQFCATGSRISWCTCSMESAGSGAAPTASLCTPPEPLTRTLCAARPRSSGPCCASVPLRWTSTK